MTLICGPLMEFINQSRTENGCSETSRVVSQQSKTLNVTSGIGSAEFTDRVPQSVWKSCPGTVSSPRRNSFVERGSVGELRGIE